MNLPKIELVVPPEEESHQRTFMQWPVNRTVHPDASFLDHLQRTIADIANTINDFEPVVMLAAAEDHAAAKRYLSASVALWDIATEDLWCRDSGPLFARRADGELAVSHIQFNGWGAKQLCRRDAKIARAVADRLEIPVVEHGLIGEPGGVEHDGHGLLIGHESSWLNDNRNPGMTRREIEDRLLRAYGATQMIWAPGVYDEDITDYHIDSLARFTAPRRVLMNLPDKPVDNDPFHRAARVTYDVLIDAGLSVDVIPEPRRPRVDHIDFVASYANYYVCNGAVVAAEFGDEETDRFAHSALASHFPDREIVMLNVDALGEVGGGIHCSTQQMPRV